MEEKTREAVALFRFGLISPISNDQVDTKEYLAKTISQKYEVRLWTS